jgi:5-methylcytosine-specific restriction endonuclease McrA
MPCDMTKYSPMWTVIRAKIISRAENRCELCNAENYKPHWKTGSKVVLTIHHINYDTADDSNYNLIALCQRCHNKLDMPLRVKNRRTTKKEKG